MRTVHLSGPPQESCTNKKPCVMALGYFDGVHLGHKKVILTAREIAMRINAELAIMTFSPHPKEIIGHGKEQVHYLLPLLHKEKIMAGLGVDTLYVVDFNETLASLSPEMFVSQYLLGLQTAHVLVGFDFNYGSKGMGNADTLEADGKGAYRVTVVPQVEYNGHKISSTLIRNLLKEGDVRQVASLLGNLYETRGRLRLEHQVFMTRQVQTEIRLLPQYMLPAKGTYEIIVEWKGRKIQGIARIDSCDINEGLVHLQMFASMDEEWRTEIINMKWVNRLSIENQLHHVDVETIRMGS